MGPQPSRRVLWPRLAGVVLILDGILCILAAGLFFLLSTFVGAVQGRPAVEEPWLLGSLVALVLAIAGIWAGQRAVRAIRRGRLVGVGVAGILALYVGWYVVTGDPGSVESTIAWAAIAAVQAAAALVLVAWPGEQQDRTLPAAVGAGRA